MAETTGMYPLEETNGNARRPPKRYDIYGSQERIPSAYREPKPARRVPSDNYNIMSDSEEVKQRRMSLKTNNSTASKKRSRNTLREQAKTGQGAGGVDDSAWIHRDKLAQIEIQEMEEAGFYVRPSRRSMSADPHASRRSSRSVSRSRIPMSESPPDEPLPNGGHIARYDTYEDKPLPSTPAAQEGSRDFDPYVDTEFRTPEEIAAEHGTARNPTIRPSTSRIPISKASPLPVPSNVKGRESPLPRSRHGSGGGSGTWDDMMYARRARSSSIGSQVILDEDIKDRTPPISGSPPKARVPTKVAPKSGARKGSATNGADRPGSSYSRERKAGTNTTTTSTAQRPGSRSGAAAKNSRPSTSHQHTPEGDPPWMDSMYKPDPRLPPDQQMLPTHAKRIMQEQWEKEGKSGTTYDRELNLLTDKELPQPKLQANMPPIDPLGQERTNSPRKPSPRMPSPLPSPPAEAGARTPPPPPSPRPSTSGGLRLTPKIFNTPQMPQIGTPPAPMATRVPVLDEKDEAQPKKGGCACCVVM